MSGLDADAVISEIYELLGKNDRALMDILLNGFVSDKLDKDFYINAMNSRNPFIKGYFHYDLNVRNLKVDYLNRSLERPLDMDKIQISAEEDEEAFDDTPAVNAVLNRDDILSREKGLDELMWAESDRLTLMKVFDIDVILNFVTKLKIIDRWLKLDPVTGKEMFRKLVEDIRNNRQI